MKNDPAISRRKLVPWLGLSLAAFVSSCASEGVQRRVDRRTDTLGRADQNMRIRRDARDERFERSTDRILGR